MVERQKIEEKIKTKLERQNKALIMSGVFKGNDRCQTDKRMNVWLVVQCWDDEEE